MCTPSCSGRGRYPILSWLGEGKGLGYSHQGLGYPLLGTGVPPGRDMEPEIGLPPVRTWDQSLQVLLEEMGWNPRSGRQSETLPPVILRMWAVKTKNSFFQSLFQGCSNGSCVKLVDTLAATSAGIMKGIVDFLS